ncbi:MAG: FKBP-type peptidyl-prolyl cis-trans isomerase [Janthinobacterium lividum]
MNLRLLFLAGTAMTATAVAQTGSTTGSQTGSKTGSTTVHHTTSATHRTGARSAARSECVVLPAISPKVPALPAGSPCAKALFTVSERLDAISPMVGPEVREDFSNLPMIFTLAYVDTHVGTGELAKPHMFYSVNYTGYLATDGSKFDSSYDHPDKKPISFPYGGHRVIPGWDTGFEGMHVGGKRRLFIPYQLAYGERGRPPAIPAKAELIFDMELVSQSAEDPTPRPVPPVTPVRPATPGQPGTLPSTPPTGSAPGTTTSPSPTPDTTKPTPPAGTVPTTPSTPPAVPKQTTPQQ